MSTAEPTRALACGPTPTPRFDVASQEPLGEAVPLNAPLVVKLLAGSNADPGADDLPLAPMLSLLRVDTEEVVPVRSVGGYDVLSFVPEQPLEPNTTYRAGFTTGQTNTLLPNPPGNASWEFTTGDSLEAPLALTGALEVTLEEGTDPVLDCLCGCTETGEVVPVTKARVKLPQVSGGFAERSAQLWLTDDRPYAFTTEMKSEPFNPRVQLSQVASLEASSPQDVLITVPDEDFSYQPCFALAATDARGDVVYAEPVCLAALPPVIDEVEPSAQPASRSRTTSACSFGPGVVTHGAWLVVAALAAAALRRRLASAERRRADALAT